MSIERAFLDSALTDVWCWRPTASPDAVATRRGSRAGDVGAAQKI